MQAWMSLDEIRSLWWSGEAALWHIKLHLSYLATPYQPGQRTFSDTQTQESVSKSHLGRWQLRCDFSLWQYFSEICFIFFYMKKKNAIKDYSSYRPCSTIRVKIRKWKAIIASINFSLHRHCVAFDCFAEKYVVTGLYTEKKRFQRWTKDKADELSIHRSLAEEKLFSIGESFCTLTPCLYNKGRLITWGQRVMQCGHISISSLRQLTQTFGARFVKWNVKFVFNLGK